MKQACVALIGLFIAISASASQQALSEWNQSQKTDALRGISYPQFILIGKWLTPPKHGADAPSLVIHCQPGRYSFGHANGKFIDGYFVAGAVLDAHVGTGGASSVTVQYRLDDKKIQSGFWGPSTDYGGAFFSAPELDNLLYGHMLPHKEGTGDPVRKVVIAADEYLAAQVVAQFDMPDPTQVAEACGVIFHKR